MIKYKPALVTFHFLLAFFFLLLNTNFSSFSEFNRFFALLVSPVSSLTRSLCVVSEISSFASISAMDSFDVFTSLLTKSNNERDLSFSKFFKSSINITVCAQPALSPHNSLNLSPFKFTV